MSRSLLALLSLCLLTPDLWAAESRPPCNIVLKKPDGKTTKISLLAPAESYSLNDLLSLLEMAPSARPVLEGMDTLLKKGELEFVALTPKLLEINPTLKLHEKAAAAFVPRDEKMGFVLTSPKMEVGALLIALHHELVHATDPVQIENRKRTYQASRDFEAALKKAGLEVDFKKYGNLEAIQKLPLSKAKRSELADLWKAFEVNNQGQGYFGEVRAYKAQAEFIREMKKAISCFGKYVEHPSVTDAILVTEESPTPAQILEVYRFSKEAVQQYAKKYKLEDPLKEPVKAAPPTATQTGDAD